MCNLIFYPSVRRIQHDVKSNQPSAENTHQTIKNHQPNFSVIGDFQ
jgi:hypothetical protein